MSGTNEHRQGMRPEHRELPYAAAPVTTVENSWAWLRTAAGKTDSEGKLLQLARGSILSLWCVPGPYTHEGLSGCGSGTELCDLMVVFGDDVLLFSDKECAFPQQPDPKVAWSRWYRRAIDKSARQLSGAAASVRRAGTRLYSDAACKSELPLRLPPAERMRIHLIAVAHGAVAAAERYWESIGGRRESSGSLFLNSKLVGKNAHLNEPFHVGWPLGRGEFVHVLDDHTLPLLLQELDTVADLTDYLAKKEALLRTSGCDFLIPGEEELLTMYLSTVHEGRTHHFPPLKEGALLVLREGGWHEFRSSKAYAARAGANARSYLWDNLIEYQVSHVIHGSTEQLFVGEGPPRPDGDERILRAMASENRLTRRFLGETLREGRSVSSKQQRWLRTIARPEQRRLYCFLFLPFFPEQQPQADYRQYRQYLLHLYCEGALLRFERAKQVIGIAPDPYDSGIASADFMLFDVRDSSISEEHREHLEAQLRKENLWKASALSVRTFRDVTYPYTPTLADRIGHIGKQFAQTVVGRRGQGRRG